MQVETKKLFFNENECNKLYSSGYGSARIYDTPKMHKFSSSDLFSKLRQIVSSISTFNYNLACFLCDLLSLLAPSLFTNIPLQETIDIAINLFSIVILI